MDLNGAVAVVTGGGSGIGRALCERLGRTASVVVVVDLDGDAAARAASALGSTSAPVRAESEQVDVADADAVRSLVEGVVGRHGRIDLYCSNAGIGSAAGIDAGEQVWDRMWQVNVMAHVHALTPLLGHWLDRGRGHLLVTASAAGLLTNLGDAPYSVTKHAAVALAEWVAITYGDRGVGVSCLCPQGVRTPLLFGDGDDSLATAVVRSQRILEPDHVADVAVSAIEEDRFLVLPHPEVADYEQARARDRERWLDAMRRMQARLDPT